MRFTIDLQNGKYTYIVDEHGSRALWYGEIWRDLTGDKFVYSLAVEVDKLRFQKEKLLEFVEEYIEACGGSSIAEKLVEQIKKEDNQ